MTRMPMFCPRCNRIHGRGERCPLTARQSEHNRAYDSSEYRRNRLRALDMTDGRCAICGARIAERERGSWRMLQGGVHHVVNLQDGGGHSVGNLLPMCDRCHTEQHRM